MSEKVSLYNPRDTPPEQLEAMLTGRELLVKEILDSLREQADASTRQHWLLRGPRGIGKTHLTGIIHHRVSTDPELSKVYLPLWLGEADVYEVYSPATLLMRIAERLVEAVPGAKLGEELLTLEGSGDEDALFEDMAARLTEEAARQKRILLVLMENLDALFESFAPKQRTAQTRQLRSLLLDNPSVLFISTTPTRYLQELSNPKAPLFAQLKERRLSQLKVEEVGALFSKLAQLTGRKEMLGSGPDAVLKQRIIHQLTGGLPRSVVMAFEILRDKEGIQTLVEDLRAFLDAQTAYFEARLSRLAARERAIVTTLALADSNLTLKEVADKSRLPEKSLSTLMARLVQEGHVEAVEGSGGKGTLYGLSEGLFRIWYQYRKGRFLLEPLVRFLAYWYEPGELGNVFETMRQRLDHEGPRAGRAARLAFLQVQAAFNLATSEQGRLERQRIWDECRQAMERDTSQVSPRLLDQGLEQALSEAINLMFSGQGDEGREAMERALAAHEPLSMHTALESARFLVLRAVALSKESGFDKPEVFQWITTRFESSQYDIVRAMAAYACFWGVECLRTLGRHEEALARADAILALPEVKNPKLRSLFPGTAITRMVILGELGRNEEVVDASRALLRVSRDQTLLQYDAATHQSLFFLSKALAALSRHEELEQVLEELASRDASRLPVEFKKMSSSAAVELFLIKIINGKIGSSEFIDELARHLDEQGDVFASMPADVLGELIAMVGVAVGADKASAASSSVRSLVVGLLGQDVGRAVSVFLKKPKPFFLLLPVDDVRAWLEQMLDSEVAAEQKAQLQLYLRLAKLLEVAKTRGPKASDRLDQELGRIPSEIRELYKSLVSMLRESA
ncbi:ATP-binding protein [Pyxidicoccus xibeiensis]|uniref:ATP-binding protein n=1 Tax=Pyxidicoccus xibeiensis TaxID=2906759 RepID=UPI0020A7CEDB|nr:ATP-binding protein [Pyxidicoccus xibeiensis]MCP3136224.1 ATP-binding protein [Pyxidicoccus xibeiensis]